MTPLRIPVKRPNLNAHAGRFVLSARSECLDKLVLVGEHHLRTAAGEILVHYHTERHHRVLGGRLIEIPQIESRAGPVACREWQGGLSRYYYRDAA